MCSDIWEFHVFHKIVEDSMKHSHIVIQSLRVNMSQDFDLIGIFLSTVALRLGKFSMIFSASVSKI